MVEDSYGRPGAPVCGISTQGLWLRPRTSWDSVAEDRRCSACSELD